MKNSAKTKMSEIVVMHYIKLVFRSLLFLSTLSVYIFNRIHNTGEALGGFENNHILLTVIWLVFFVEMLLRFFPSRLESMGCQKQFKSNYIEIENPEKIPDTKLSTFLVVVFWVLLNGIIALLYYLGIADNGVMLLIALFYSVCDVICILFFCPFQTLIMKNKCCATCRIYNWDYAMMFTPLLFVNNVYALSLSGLSVILLVKWEYVFFKHPERFFTQTNKNLSCANCSEKLCQHKTQLRHFLKKEKFNLKGNLLFK